MLASLITFGLACGVVSAATETYHDNNAQCDCYEVDAGGSPVYYHNFRFYDFSHLANTTTDFTSEPSLVTTTGGKEGTTSSIFDSDWFNNDWSIQNWGMAPTTSGLLPRWNSPQNVYLMQTNASDMGSAAANATTFLRLRASRNSDFYSIGEIDNQQTDMLYASVRFYARVTGSKGTCGGMFLYADSNDETDVEILTNYPGEIYYSNQPDTDSDGNEITGATQIAGTKNLDWTQWHEHRIDWTPGMTYWYIDSTLVANMTYQVPKVAMGTIINMWSDGSVWTGDMPTNGVSKLDVQWVQATFNTTSSKSGHSSVSRKRKESACKQVCKIDGVSQIGYPEFGSPTFTAAQSYTGGSGSSGSAGASASKGSSSRHHARSNLVFGGFHAAAAMMNSAFKLF